MGNRYRFIVVLLSILSVVSACNLPGFAERPSVSTDLLYTQAVQTIIAQLTVAAPSQITPLPPTATPTEGLLSLTPLPPTQTPTLTATPEPSATPTLTPLPERLFFEDDFSRDRNWYIETNNRFGLEYYDGGYHIYVNIRQAPIWSVRHNDLADVHLEVDARRISGPENGYYGLVCRHVDENNYYALVIGSDGSYGISKMKDGEYQFIREGKDQAGVIQRGNQSNRLRADCFGDTLTLYVNGQKLLQISDDDFASGYVGLLAGTRMSGGLDVYFDNFAIYIPE